jgi:predicted permease
VDVLLQDLKFGIRSLRRTPAFTAVVIAVMALGIGVNTMVFSMVYGVMIRPLPLPGAERLVSIDNWEIERASNGDFDLSQRQLLEIRARAKSFEAVGGWWDHNAFVVIDKDVERYYGTTCTSDLFATLGVKPQLGRGISKEEEAAGKNWSTVLISDRIWKTKYGGTPDVLGKTLRLNGRTRTIVGVMPPNFRWPEIQDFWIPMGFDPAEMGWADFSIETAGRLKPGVTAAQANAEIAAIQKTLAADHVELKQYAAKASPYREHMMSDIAPMMTMMMISVVFVLLIACSNVANLLLARAAGRQREIALRFALGARRSRIIRQLLTESTVLAGVGAVLGIVIAHWSTKAYLSLIPLEMPFWMRFDIDAAVLLYTAGAAMFSGIVFGLAPALQASDKHLGDAIREGSVQSGSSRHGDRIRSSLVVAEVALSLILLVGAGLMIRSFLNLNQLNSKVHTDNILTAQILMPIANYPDDPSKRTAMRALIPQMQQLPGLKAWAATTRLPLNRGSWTRRTYAPGSTHPDDKNGLRTNYAATTPGYFDVIGIPLLKGRDFTAQDDENSARVCVVNQSFANSMWPGKDPIGQQVRFVGEPDSLGTLTVVGLVGDVPFNVEEKTGNEGIYVSHMASAEQTLTLVLHTNGTPGAIAGPLRAMLRTNHPDMPISEIRTMPEYLQFTKWQNRLFTSLFATFAILALLIAGVGIYGVMAYSVAQRTREIGIRMALGAARSQVLSLVVGRAMRLTIIGTGIGLAGAYAVTRLMANMLFGVSASDPPTFVGVSLILVVSAIAAAWFPAHRATQVDPIVALRHD